MKISIIVPVYNMASEGKLNYCLDSLINQTIRDYEIIAVNDASTDNSLEVLKEYESKYPDIFKVITYENNLHQGGARNRGMKAASGEWIAFIDADDWVSPDYYESLVRRAEETGADCVGSKYTITYSHSFETGEIYYSNTPDQTGLMDDAHKRRMIKNSASVVMRIYKREVIEENNLSFPEHMFYEDNAIAPVWLMYIRHFELCEGPLYYYYMHDNSTVHTITEERSKDRLKAIEIFISEMKARGFYETYKEEIENVFIRLYLVNTLFGYMISCKRTRFSFVKCIKEGVIKYFPDFRNNKEYASIPDEEQKRMLDLFMKNTFAFYIYYGALWKYRRFRKGLSQS